MSNLAQNFLSYSINSIWQVAAVGAVGWILSCCLRRLGPQLQHMVWVITLIVAAVTPLFSCAYQAWKLPQNVAAVSSQHSLIAFAMPVSVHTENQGISLSPIFLSVLIALFLAALLYFVTRLVWRLFFVKRLLSDAYPAILNPEKQGVWKNCRQTFAIRKVQLLYCDKIGSPVVVGIVRPSILVSESFLSTCQIGDLQAAFAHECAHIHRHDYLKNLIYEVVSLWIAYHPITWFIKAQIAQTREMTCDQLASDAVSDGHSYAASLIRLAEQLSLMRHPKASHALGIFDANILERRVRKMKEKRSYLGAVIKSLITVTAALLLIGVATASGVAARTIGMKQSPRVLVITTVQGHLYADTSCTYIDPHAKFHKGKCETFAGNTFDYFCAENSNRKIFQLQQACEWQIHHSSEWQPDRTAR